MVTLEIPAAGSRGQDSEVTGVEALVMLMTYSWAHHSLIATRLSGAVVRSW